jgi:hypothetical protein
MQANLIKYQSQAYLQEDDESQVQQPFISDGGINI